VKNPCIIWYYDFAGVIKRLIIVLTLFQTYAEV